MLAQASTEREPTAAELKRIFEESRKLEATAALRRREKAAERDTEDDKLLALQKKGGPKK